MLFNSFVFLFFLGIVIPVFYALPTKNSRNIFLLFASYFFYGYWDWRFCSLLAITTIIDYYIGKTLYTLNDEKKRKILLSISVVANLGVLGFFKYFNFFAESFRPLVEALGGQADYLHLNIILPVGISFYTFQTMTYTIDIYRRKLIPAQNIIDFGLYVSFFPQLVAGPIERASNLLPQLSKKFAATREQVMQGFVLIVTGLFKKVMIGDAAGRIVDRIFSQPELYTSAELLSALILFSVQIYADFSGYSSIARGTAKLMGIELVKNFEQPYLSSNITEFWRRWHISLSSWLKDYLYIPLGGNRKGSLRTYVNLGITMVLGGLWHGASWNFVVWGGLHGLYLGIHKWLTRNKKISESFSYTGISSLFKWVSGLILTNILVLFAWLFFRAKSFGDSGYILNKFIHWETGEFGLRFLSITATFVLVVMVFDILEYITGRHTYILKLKSLPFKLAILTSMFLIVCVYMFQSKPMPFVYFQF